VTALKKKGVTQAWVGSFDGLLHRDVSAVNSRLAADCQKHGPNFLVPLGVINPTLSDWREDLRRCYYKHHMPGIRLYPNYHGYRLDSALFHSVIEMAASHNLVVQLSAALEDERTQNALIQLPPVDMAHLSEVISGVHGLRLIIVNWKNGLTGDLARRLCENGEIYFDFAMLEEVGGLEKLCRKVPVERVVFGSNFPLFYFDAAALKVRESRLSKHDQISILRANAQRLLSTTWKRRQDS
jgi:predicted TIM-barrel fold metal-dependent hydrolase